MVPCLVAVGCPSSVKSVFGWTMRRSFLYAANIIGKYIIGKYIIGKYIIGKYIIGKYIIGKYIIGKYTCKATISKI